MINRIIQSEEKRKNDFNKMNIAIGSKSKILHKYPTNILLKYQNRRRKNWERKNNQWKYLLGIKAFSAEGKLREFSNRITCSIGNDKESPSNGREMTPDWQYGSLRVK